MKKTFLCIASVMTFGLVSQAQVTITPKVGATFGNYAYGEEQDEEETTKYNSGLTLGAGFNFALGEVFSIQPELLYVQKGFKMSEDDSYIKTHFNFIEIPVLARASFGSETVKAYVNAGPSLGYGLNGKSSFKFSGMGVTVSGTEKIRFAEEPDNGGEEDVTYLDPKEVNRVDLGLQFGAGVGFQAGPGSLVLDLRYGLGMSNFYKTQTVKNNNVTITTEGFGKSRTLAFTVGYAIPLGGK
jgi:hypothetical protein